MATALGKQMPEPPPMNDPLIGRSLGGHYRISGLLGRGGMSRVYQAVQSPLDRAVAIKVLRDDPEDPSLKKRFLFEASVTSKLTHPNTITIFDYGVDQGVLYFAMELLRGSTLSQALKRDGRFPEERALHIARQVCRSLREAHAMGLVHRDLKPSNFFLLDRADEHDFVKVLDFGLVKVFGKEELEAQLTPGGSLLGTPHYMAPEQARGRPCDERSDIYSLGVVLFQMVAGVVPYDGDNAVDVLLRHASDPVPFLREAVPGLEVSVELEAVVARCMAKKPEDRFRNMSEVLAALPGADLYPSFPPGRARSSSAGLQPVPDPLPSRDTPLIFATGNGAVYAGMAPPPPPPDCDEPAPAREPAGAAVSADGSPPQALPASVPPPPPPATPPELASGPHSRPASAPAHAAAAPSARRAESPAQHPMIVPRAAVHAPPASAGRRGVVAAVVVAVVAGGALAAWRPWSRSEPAAAPPSSAGPVAAAEAPPAKPAPAADPVAIPPAAATAIAAAPGAAPTGGVQPLSGAAAPVPAKPEALTPAAVEPPPAAAAAPSKPSPPAPPPRATASARPERPQPARRPSAEPPARKPAKVAAAASAAPELVDELKDRLAHAVPGIRQCVMLEADSDLPPPTGTLELKVTVEPQGAITAIDLAGPKLGKKLDACVRAAVKKIKFDRFEGAPLQLRRTVALAAAQ